MQVNSILINLPKRTERLNHSKKELAKFFGSFYSVVYPGIDMIENTTLAIRESHKRCVLWAKNNNKQNIIIIEDDICFRENSFEYFNELMDNLPTDYEVCLFGIYSGKVIETDNAHWNKVNKFSGCHFYLVNKSAYEKIINYNGTQPIDHWIGQNLNCYISKKHFAYQKDGWSDNSKCFTDYNATNLSNYKSYLF